MINNRLKQSLIWAMPVTWMGLIFLSSRTPYEKQDVKPALASHFDLSVIEPFVDGIAFTYHQSVISVASLGIERFIEFFIRKGAHVFVFFVLTILLAYAFKKTTHLSITSILIYSYLIATIYACLDELNQSMTPNRTPYIGDVVLDSFGSLLAIMSLYVFFVIRQRKSANKA